MQIGSAPLVGLIAFLFSPFHRGQSDAYTGVERQYVDTDVCGPTNKGETEMQTLIQTLAALAAGAMITTAFAQSAKDIRGASPYVAIDKEPAPKLIVDPPLPEGLALGVFWAQYRVENLRIVPVFGTGALQVSPRIGHLHITVDDLPWWWADASDNNTVDIAGLPPGDHKVKIELVDANHEVIRGQSKTLTFTIPEGASLSHSH